MKISFRDPKNYITVSVPGMEINEIVVFFSLFGRGDVLCKANF